MKRGLHCGAYPRNIFGKKTFSDTKSQQTNKNQVLSMSSSLGVGVLVFPDKQTLLGGRKREVAEGVGGSCLSGGGDNIGCSHRCCKCVHDELACAAHQRAATVQEVCFCARCALLLLCSRRFLLCSRRFLLCSRRFRHCSFLVLIIGVATDRRLQHVPR